MVTKKLSAYQDKRDFTRTSEPRGDSVPGPGSRLRFVIQKHAASRLHYDLRLELDGVFKSWAVTRGPSLDPQDKRLAVEVEDHPLDYGDFEGTIPKGEYGGGTVQLWDRGTWSPEGMSAEEGLAAGDLKFTLDGEMLHGSWVLVRMKHDRRGGKSSGKHANWLLIKHRDSFAREGDKDALLDGDRSVASGRTMAAIAAGTGKAPRPFMAEDAPSKNAVAKDAVWDTSHGIAAEARTAKRRSANPSGLMANGAVRAVMPQAPGPQLCSSAKTAPTGKDWVYEIKFDGYRFLAARGTSDTRLLTRNGHDWADRLPALKAAILGLELQDAIIDGELVCQGKDGVTSFPALQAALTAGRDDTLVFYAFDLLYLDGWDLRGCSLLDRKAALARLVPGTGMIGLSEHHQGRAAEMTAQACQMKLEGLVFKRANARYRSGRGADWVKVKCQGREELIVLGWTPPGGSRKGIGSLHLGYYDPRGALHYAGGVGSGLSDSDLVALRKRLEPMQLAAPPKLMAAGDPIDPAVVWVRPEIVVEVEFTAWSGAGRVRHGVYLGERMDKAASEVVRDISDPDTKRVALASRTTASKRGKPSHGAIPPVQPATAPLSASTRVVVAKAPKSAATMVSGVKLSHPDRELWPGVTKLDLARYWQAVAEVALPGLAQRPLSILRCPDGIDGREHFFQKNGHGIMPSSIREGLAAKQPYLAIDDVAGLVAMAQMSAIELHPWGATEADPTHPDRLIFDLDPGEGVAFSQVITAALDVRDRLKRLKLVSFCRTSGGKGLHVVVPLVPEADWTEAKAFCRAFAETMSQDAPDRYVAHVKIEDRRGRILVDWLRNGLGATAVASFSPRARPGATVATPLSWREVVAGLDPASHTIQTIPNRLSRLKTDPWKGLATTKQCLPKLGTHTDKPEPATPRKAGRIVVAKAPARKR